MSATSVITQTDTLQINNQVFSTFANNDCGKLTFPDELVEMDIGKNGNIIAAVNFKGQIVDFELRLLLAAVDDQYLNGILNQYQSGAVAFNTGVFVKNVVDQNNDVLSATMAMSGGIISKAPELMTSASGNVEQAVAVWHIRFGYWQRKIT